MMQLIKGCKPADMDVVDVFTPGGASEPNTVVEDEPGVLEFKTEVGVMEPGMPAPDVDDVAGVAVGVVAVGVGVAVGVDCDAEDGYMQDPLLGLVFTMVAAPPKSQLVGAGFF